MVEEEKKLITRERHPGRVTHDYKLAALMEKRKEEILHNKEQSTVQSTEQSSVQSTAYSTVYSSQMVPVSMALVYLLSFPLMFVYFLHITLLRLKNSSMKKRSTTKMTSYGLEKYIINE